MRSDGRTEREKRWRTARGVTRPRRARTHEYGLFSAARGTLLHPTDRTFLACLPHALFGVWSILLSFLSVILMFLQFNINFGGGGLVLSFVRVGSCAHSCLAARRSAGSTPQDFGLASRLTLAAPPYAPPATVGHAPRRAVTRDAAPRPVFEIYRKKVVYTTF